MTSKRNTIYSDKKSFDKAKEFVKNIIGDVPFAVELYWLVRHRDKHICSRFSLEQLSKRIPEIVEFLKANRITPEEKKKIFLFASLHYWIEHVALVGSVLSALGHEVYLGYLPYHDWQNEINRFDLKRQNIYAQTILGKLSPYITPISFLGLPAAYKMLPPDIQDIVQKISDYDTQYTLQKETIDPANPIYKLRLRRNARAARCAFTWLSANKPDTVIIPNATIQEFAVVYEVAQHFGITAVSYEFCDQQQRIWLAQNRKVMRQETDQMWEAYKDVALTRGQKRKIHELFEARRKASVWKNFSRLWQPVPAIGVKKAREELGLDERPVALLATNVLGDSLTLGRDIFTNTMEEWIVRTLQYFSGRSDVQFIIRVHPGEVLTHGQSMVDVVNRILPKLPENIHLIKPEDKTNTYDLIAASDLGLVYTTTVGLEIAMSGVPVIVVGDTHYRERGFTHDLRGWRKYYRLIGDILEDPNSFRLTSEEIDLAWAYAYRFFFDYPRPFPWHLAKKWKNYDEYPIEKVLSSNGRKKYLNTFNFLAGNSLDWNAIRDGKV